MRQNPNTRRSRGRGGRKPGNSRNQVVDSNGPGARVRGNSAQIYEKYQQLARDATSAGDRVAAENYLQHAEHYYRLLEPSGANRNAQDDQQQRNDNRHQNDGTAQNNGAAQHGDAAPSGNVAPNGGAVESSDDEVITEAAPQPTPQPASQPAPQPVSEHAPESVAALIEAVEQGDTDQPVQTPPEVADGSGSSEGDAKPARRTRSRRSNGSGNGRTASVKDADAAAPEDDSEPASEDSNPASA